MTTDQQAIADRMIEHLEVALDDTFITLFEDDENHFTTHDCFGDLVKFTIDPAAIKAQILSRAKEDVQRLPTLLTKRSLTAHFLKQFADSYCELALTLFSEACDATRQEIAQLQFGSLKK